METRSRKRGEASSTAPSSSSNKRPRRSSRPQMDSPNESSSTARRGKASDGSDKGKEKEQELRARLNMNINNIVTDSDENDEDDDDDDDESGNGGMLRANLTSASTALQGIWEKLGARLDELLPASAAASNTRHKKILSGLRADGEEGKQIESLTQLCELLSIGTEDSLGTFSVESFVPVLVGLLNHENNPDIMLLAARALTHLCDVLPSSCSAVVHYGAVSCFVARLLTIEYMDLAEQSLQALKKISQENPTACLRAGALMAVLSYLDFFSTGVQRVALSTAANMCRKLPSDASDFVMEAVPLLTNLLQYHDAKVLEHASVCLTRIAEAFASSPDKLDELCNHGLVTQAASLISTSSSGGAQASLSTSTYTGLIRLLSTCASGSPLGGKTLLLLGISGILKDILAGSGLVASMSVSAALSRPADQIFEIVNLANELLPPLPEGSITLPASSNLFIKGPLSKQSTVGSSSKQEVSNVKVAEATAREKLLNDQAELLKQFGMDLLPVLIQVYESSVNGPVRHKCLSVIGKLMYFSPADMIQSLLSLTNISSFLAGVLASKDPQVLVPSLQVAEILMEKLPGTFSKMFVREGVLHSLDTLILPVSPSTAFLPSSKIEKDNNIIPGTASRSKRNRGRGGNSNSDTPYTEDCPVPAIGSPPNSLESPPVSSSIRMEVSARAKFFKEKYFPSTPGATKVGVTEDLLNLKNLCQKLNASIDNQSIKSKGKSKASGSRRFEISCSKEDDLIVVISEMLAELNKGDGVSTFEFIGSGVVPTLLNYFSCGYFSKDRISVANLYKLRQLAIRRYKSFVAVALPSSVGGNVAPMDVLVQKLQNALSSLEHFPVVLSHSARSSGGSSRMSSGLSALSQPFKLRLCRAQGEKSLRDYSSNIVLIDPLANVAAVESFLWPRVQQSESGQKLSASGVNSDPGTKPTGTGALSPSTFTPASTTRRHSTRSRSSVNIGETAKKESPQEKNASSSKGKGKAILKPAQEQASEPQTRHATRRRASLDKEAQVKPVNGYSSSEDEEFDMSQAEIEAALMIEDDDISEDDDDDILRDGSLPICTTNEVHDVKLGESAEDTSDKHTNPACGSTSRATTVRASDAADRSGNSFSTRGAMSFAAAAMAGLASSNGGGVKGGRDRLGHTLLGSDDPPRLIFSAGGKQLDRHLTIAQAQAIQRQLVLDEDDGDRCDGSEGSRPWGDICTVTYQRADNPTFGSSTTPKSAKTSSDSTSHQKSLLDSLLQGELPCDLEKVNPTYDILALLRVLEGLNQLAPRLRVEAVTDCFSEGKISCLDELSTASSVRVPQEEFINSKLTPKLARQIQDALALCSGNLPPWCYQLTKACPFLFPFETRRQYFYSTAFGLSRALHRLQQQQQGADGQGSTNERELRVGRLQRQKVRVSRNRILDSAAKVMKMYSSQKAVLEVEYFGEVGTGLGPTLEFYTLLSHDLQKVGLGMWRPDSSFDKPSAEVNVDDQKDVINFGTASVRVDGNFVQSPLGLFPRPWSPNDDSFHSKKFCKVVDYFQLFGCVIAKALQDGRLLDMPLSTSFYKLVLGQELDLHDIVYFDAEFGKTLLELQALVCRRQYLESMGDRISDEIVDLRFRGSPIEDLCLEFTLPGYPDYVLKAEDKSVTIDNLEEYIAFVVDATISTGIQRQMEAFRAGFNQVFDISALQIFTPNELDYMLCGRRELWEAESLVEHIKFDHGFTAKSPAIVNLLEIMGEFTPEQQQAFCRFVTGAPRLPPGGLAVLNPKLTIVRKHSSTSNNTAAIGSGGLAESSDDDLPSVMTCANYLKLPPYSTKEIMYKKLMYAISEGQGSFDLS